MPNYPRGSEWRRWDLHVHSPLSILNNQFKPLPSGSGPDWDAYVDALEAAPIAVYGITDYFTVDGYKELRRRQQQGRLQEVLLLPNIEFRLDQIVSSRHDGSHPRRLNMHVIFSEDVPIEDIEEHFLHDLKFVYQETPTDISQALTLKVANLTRLGERLISEHEAFKGQPALEVGAAKAVVSLSAILKKLKEDPRFENKYLLVLPADGWDDIPWDGQDHHVRKMLLQATDFVFASNPKTVTWCLGQPPYGEGVEAFRREFRTVKPCIHGSDAHAVEEIAHPCSLRSVATHNCQTNPKDCDLRNCWIKADPTFEGLRQVLYEPADRVRIQTANPDPSKTQFCLTDIRVEDTPVNAELHVTATQLPLNTGLVAVTGGRGSGKTALVDLLAHCFVNRADSDDKNSFVRRVKDSGAQFRTTIRFLSGEEFSKSLLDGRFVDDSNVVYIAQGELEKYIGEGSDLNQYVHSLVFNSEELRNSTVAYEYQALAGEAEEQQAALDQLNEEIEQLEQATAPLVLVDLQKTGKQARAEVNDLKKRVADAEVKLTAEKVAAAEARQKTLDELKARRQLLSAAKAAVHDARRFIGTDLARFTQLIRAVNVAVVPLGLAEDLALPAYPDTVRLTALGDSIDRQIVTVLDDIEKHEKELKTLAAEQKDHASLLGKKRDSEMKLAQLQDRWKAITERQSTLETKKGDRTGRHRTLLQMVLQQRAKYDEIIQRFSAAKDKVLSDLGFQAEIVLDQGALLEDAEVVLDNRQAEVYGSDKVPSVFAALTGLLGRLPSEGEAVRDAIVVETDRLATDLRDKLKKARSVGPLNLYKLLFHSYLSVEPVVRYKNVPLDRLSLGQKTTVLMKIYLAEGDTPIIIDSHDDHLDNESIMDELVGSIRQAKQFRQVILASNNGNVVINSDADQLVIALRDGGNITYISGSLENALIRERALRVLEGGPEAFRRRQEKYRLSR
jgi:predicted nuclease with TOPRIM domain